MTNQIIVLVSDEHDVKCARISEFDQEAKAANFVENLLAAGFEQSRMKVFTASDVAIKIDYRPVVSIVTDVESGEVENEDEAWESGLFDAGKVDVTPPLDYRRVASVLTAGAPDKAENTDEVWPGRPFAASGESASPSVVAYTKNGVRFSSMFSPGRIARVDVSAGRKFIQRNGRDRRREVASST